jgi:predicted secreted Zn-dependent protease
LPKQPRARRLALEHEQGHFDLSEAHGRRLEARLAALTAEAHGPAQAKGALREAARRAYGDAMRALAAEQARYDRETLHGNRLARQRRWAREIAARLLGAGAERVALAARAGAE